MTKVKQIKWREVRHPDIPPEGKFYVGATPFHDAHYTVVDDNSGVTYAGMTMVAQSAASIADGKRRCQADFNRNIKASVWE